MMIFPSTTVVLLVNRSSSIPPLKILAGVVIETKNRPDENEEAFSSLRDDCPHSCCYFIAKCFVAVFCGKCITPKALEMMMLSSRSSAVASTSFATSLRCSKTAAVKTRRAVVNIGRFVRSLSAVSSSSSDDGDGEKFVPIDYESQNAPGETANGRFGPDAILLIGFTPTERTTVREMLNDMGADFIDLITCTKEMYETMSLRECMGVTQREEDEKVFSVAGVQTKIVIMSGMIGAEVASVVDAFYESQFKDNAPAFACAVPNSWEKPIKQTAEEISGDHAEATKQRSA